MAKDLDLLLLLDIYGNMLTERQYDTLQLYYEEDLSLGEIAENMEITRQAVHNCVKKGREYLVLLEETLCLAEKFTSLLNDIECLEVVLREANPQNKAAEEKIKRIISNIKEKI